MAHGESSNQKSNTTMKVSFEINKPVDKFETGRVSLTASDAREIIQLLKKDRILEEDPVAFAKGLTAALDFGNATYKDPAPHFLVETTLREEFTEPYIKGLERLAGAPIPELYTTKIDVLSAFAEKTAHLPLLRADMHGGHFSFELAYEDYHVKNETDIDVRFSKAVTGATGQVEETLGVRPYEREYLDAGGGLFKLNPRYANGRRLPVTPCIAYVPLWDLLLMWWKDNVASPIQKAAVEEIIEGGPDKSKAHLLGYSGQLCWHPDYQLYLPDTHGDVVYGSGKVKRVRIIKDLKESSLSDWTPGINITTSEI